MRYPTVSVSIAGNDVGAVESFALGEAFQMPIFQAAPNVGQGSFDWGSFYPEIINVGAWNVDANNELLISSFQTFDTIDIVADGYVLNSEWDPDTSFGTSFATPRVSASYVNLVNDYIDELNQAKTQHCQCQNTFDTASTLSVLAAPPSCAYHKKMSS